MKNQSWRSIVYRLFGVLNFVVVTVGTFFELSSAAEIRSGAVGNTLEAPYFIPSFWIMTAFNFCFLGLLLLGGIYLIRLKDRGVTICNVVMLAEIVYFLLVGRLWAASKPLSLSVAGATGIANVGIAVQLVNWVRWPQGSKVEKTSSQEAQTKTSI